MRLLLPILAIICLTLVVCDDDPAPTAPVARTLADVEWVSACAIYDDTLSHKAHSLVFIGASWCGWCNKLKNETLCNASVQDEMNEYFNPVMIEVTADSQVCYLDTTVLAGNLPSYFGVTGYPTTIALDSNEQVMSRLVGFHDAASFLGWLQTLRGAQ